MKKSLWLVSLPFSQSRDNTETHRANCVGNVAQSADQRVAPKSKKRTVVEHPQAAKKGITRTVEGIEFIPRVIGGVHIEQPSTFS